MLICGHSISLLFSYRYPLVFVCFVFCCTYHIMFCCTCQYFFYYFFNLFYIDFCLTCNAFITCRSLLRLNRLVLYALFALHVCIISCFALFVNTFFIDFLITFVLSFSVPYFVRLSLAMVIY